MPLVRWWNRCIMLGVASLASICANAQVSGISADSTVSQVPYSTFQGQTAEQVWVALDAVEYWAVPSAVPPQYYAGVDLSSADTLRQTLHSTIIGHAVFPYDHSSLPGQVNHRVDVWDVVALADAHPKHPDRVLDLYLNDKFDRQYGGGTDKHYDREHTWPKSLGFPTKAPSNPAYSDCHHLVAAYQNYNASRGNKPYGSGPDDPARRKPTMEELGRGGSNHDDELSANYSFSDRWQTWIGRRGDVARAMFYMDVRYDGGTNEADLQLTNDISLIVNRNVWETGGIAYMGLLDDLVRWHKEDPVDDVERRRNTVVFLFQGNRNPFIDHPEWVDPIFAGGPMPGASGGGITPSGGPTPPSNPAVWISEIHYDNAGDDEDEFVEVTGKAGSSLDGWSLVAYNGNGGKAYKTVALTGVIEAERDGFGAVAFSMSGLQNGPPDGVALVNASGVVVDFISYEGQFNGSDGPAAGVPSVDIKVEETGTTAKGHSLQRLGAGANPATHTWTGPAVATKGRLASGQTFR